MMPQMFITTVGQGKVLAPDNLVKEKELLMSQYNPVFYEQNKLYEQLGGIQKDIEEHGDTC